MVIGLGSSCKKALAVALIFIKMLIESSRIRIYLEAIIGQIDKSFYCIMDFIHDKIFNLKKTKTKKCRTLPVPHFFGL